MVAAEALAALSPLVRQLHAAKDLELILSDVVRFEAEAQKARDNLAALEAEVSQRRSQVETERTVLLAKFRADVHAASDEASKAQGDAAIVVASAAADARAQCATEAQKVDRLVVQREALAADLDVLHAEAAAARQERDSLAAEIAALRQKVASILA